MPALFAIVAWVAARMRNAHLHHFEYVTHRLSQPEGGVYYQLTCTQPGCRKRIGDRRFKPPQIVGPSVLYSVRVRTDQMTTLLSAAQQRGLAPVTYLDRLIRDHLAWKARLDAEAVVPIVQASPSRE